MMKQATTTATVDPSQELHAAQEAIAALEREAHEDNRARKIAIRNGEVQALVTLDARQTIRDDRMTKARERLAAAGYRVWAAEARDLRERLERTQAHRRVLLAEAERKEAEAREARRTFDRSLYEVEEIEAQIARHQRDAPPHPLFAKREG